MGKLPGLQSVEGDLPTKEVRVSGGPAAIRLDVIEAAMVIVVEGYPVAKLAGIIAHVEDSREIGRAHV